MTSFGAPRQERRFKGLKHISRARSMACVGQMPHSGEAQKTFYKVLILYPALASSLFELTGQVSLDSTNTYSPPSERNWWHLAWVHTILLRINTFLTVYICEREIPLPGKVNKEAFTSGILNK